MQNGVCVHTHLEVMKGWESHLHLQRQLLVFLLF